MKTTCVNTVTTADVPLQSLDDGWFHHRALRVSVLRLDLLHPVVSGNKWYKLKYNLEAAVQAGCRGVLTFGGPHSNHLAAAAHAARLHGLSSIGVVRGVPQEYSPTLRFCAEEGMQLHFLDREAYAEKSKAPFVQEWQRQFPGCRIIPEGGANEEGRKGAGEIASLLPSDATHVLLSVGSGTTFAGLRNALPASVALLGFVPMKGGAYLQQEIEPWLLPAQKVQWSLTDAYHFGGFGKTSPVLTDFIISIYKRYGLPLDIVYTGKMMFGLREMLAGQAFRDAAHLVCLHTGGLQGNPLSLKQLFSQKESD